MWHTKVGNEIGIKMDTFQPIDDFTDITDYPNWFGTSWDGELRVDPRLALWNQIDWSALGEKIEEIGTEVDDRGMPVVSLNLAMHKLRIPAYGDPAFIFEQLPFLNVEFDSGPDDGGPASGAGYQIFLSNEADAQEAVRVLNEVARDLIKWVAVN